MSQGEGGGRPKIEFNAEELRRLSVLHCTQSEIAAFFGVSLSCVEKRLATEPQMKAAWDEGRALGLISLRRQQTQLAEKGNATMLIWLGKQLLGQRDNLELTGDAGGPIQTHDTTDRGRELLEARVARISVRLREARLLPEPEQRGS